jgi:ATP-dependent exoDNAse (exonuclease V) alpha subunit
MAIYHLSVKPISRKAGRSATAAAAYRAAEVVHDETTGQTFDYTRKQGVEHSEIVLPTDCAKRDINWARDRTALWNEAEKAENRSNSRVAREYEVALPHEMNRAHRVDLVRSFSQSIADRYGCAVDFAIHAPHREGDQRNHHAHLLATTRTIEAAGLGEKTEIEWSDGNRQKAGLKKGKEEVFRIREQWAAFTNDKLKELSLDARIDHRSLEAQGVEREPTTHLGPAVSSMERRGIRTEVGYRIEAEASARLERAAEMAALRHEAREVERSILSLDTSISAALAAREAQKGAKMDKNVSQEREAGTGAEREKSMTLEERQQAARDKWLKYREQQAEKGKGKGSDAENRPDQERTRDKKRDHTPDDDFSL